MANQARTAAMAVGFRGRRKPACSSCVKSLLKAVSPVLMDTPMNPSHGSIINGVTPSWSFILCMMTLTRCGWVDLPKCRKRCWFAQLPPAEELPNYITIMDDFGVSLEQTGHTFQHLMMWEPGHTTTNNSTSSMNMPADTTYHITALASANMTTGRFRAFATHIYVRGDIPRAEYSSYSSTYAVIRRGTREKMVVDESEPLPLGLLSQVCFNTSTHHKKPDLLCAVVGFTLRICAFRVFLLPPTSISPGA
ncbi:hypothetical protein BDM02DRAFT_3130024 [Thelephora ganbajun]|uniref:Uncharacterized protein n=1 Tax=Thelephora ganbajun TaxID=370292 RepID=A0ACB6ZBN1_THEGA|nr:hypothetical protein BDM02DRAFT_3130024 [Thelephora ganbajun]